jgi:hypothetical protein
VRVIVLTRGTLLVYVSCVTLAVDNLANQEIFVLATK